MPDTFYTSISATIRYRENVQNTDTIAPSIKKVTANELYNDVFKIDTLLISTENNTKTNILAILKKDLRVELFSVQFHIPKQGKLICIDRYYNINPVDKNIWNNDLTPLHIQYEYQGKQYLLTNCGQWFSYQVVDNNDFFTLIVYIDAAALHPAWSFRTQLKQPDATPLLIAGHSYNLTFKLVTFHKDSFIPIVCRYPRGAEAAFLITDHCDYDKQDTLKAFADDWLSKELKIVKGVFSVRSNKQKNTQAPTLEDIDYHTIIQEFYRNGNEISPHGLNQSGQISTEVFEKSLDKISNVFSCTTWIDHGSYLKYSYSTGGGENPDYHLTDRLLEKGYTVLWSYHDTVIDPIHSLNIFTPIQKKNTLSIINKLLTGRWLNAIHTIKTNIERNTSGKRINSLLIKLINAARIFLAAPNKYRSDTFKTLRKNIKLAFDISSAKYFPYTLTELLACSPVLFTEKKLPMHQWERGELLMFSTQEVVHTQNTYTKEKLDKLISEKGLHIGHTYLLSKLKYIDGIFTKTEESILNEKWLNFTEYLSRSVSNGNIWNPDMHMFIKHITALQTLDITYGPGECTILNPDDKKITGLTILLPKEFSSTNIKWNDITPRTKLTTNGLMVWGDIEAKAIAHIVFTF